MFEFVNDPGEQLMLGKAFSVATNLDMWERLRNDTIGYYDLKHMYAAMGDCSHDDYIRDLRFISINGMAAFRDLHLKIVNGNSGECSREVAGGEQECSNVEETEVGHVRKRFGIPESFFEYDILLCCFTRRKQV